MRSLLAFTLLTLTIVGEVVASPLVLEHPGRGRNLLVPLSAGMPRQVVVVLPVSDRQKQTLDLSVTGPTKLAVSVAAAMMTSGKTAAAAGTSRTTYPAMLYNTLGQGAKRMVIGGSSSTPGGPDPRCGCLTDEEIQGQLSYLRSLGINLTRSSFCSQFSGIPFGSCEGGGTLPDPSDPVAGNTIRGFAFIQRDQCSAQPHVAIIKLDLTGFDPAGYAGTNIVVKANVRGFDGNRRASIKPKGEGKYPVPLLLAGPVGSLGFFNGQGEVTLNKWRGAKRTKPRKVKIADTIFYPGGGGMLWRIPLTGRVLTGGKGTFDIRSKAEGYSICPVLRPVRQYFNGYTN